MSTPKKADDCLFCKFVSGEVPCHKVWESDTHIAFLTIFPNTKGFTVVAAKDHLDSDALAQDSKVLTELVLAAQQVSYKLKTAFPDVGRVGLFFEGFGMNHLHAKLFPMHGTKPMKEWKNLASAGEINTKFFHRYEGYLSSHNGERANDIELAKVTEKIRNAKV